MRVLLGTPVAAGMERGDREDRAELNSHGPDQYNIHMATILPLKGKQQGYSLFKIMTHISQRLPKDDKMNLELKNK